LGLRLEDEKLNEYLAERGLYADSKLLLRALRKLRSKYAVKACLSKVGEITGRVLQEHGVTLLEAVKKIRKG